VRDGAASDIGPSTILRGTSFLLGEAVIVGLSGRVRQQRKLDSALYARGKRC
jgi:hypothetical protein